MAPAQWISLNGTNRCQLTILALRFYVWRKSSVTEWTAEVCLPVKGNVIFSISLSRLSRIDNTREKDRGCSVRWGLYIYLPSWLIINLHFLSTLNNGLPQFLPWFFYIFCLVLAAIFGGISCLRLPKRGRLCSHSVSISRFQFVRYFGHPLSFLRVIAYPSLSLLRFFFKVGLITFFSPFNESPYLAVC